MKSFEKSVKNYVFRLKVNKYWRFMKKAIKINC